MQIPLWNEAYAYSSTSYVVPRLELTDSHARKIAASAIAIPDRRLPERQAAVRLEPEAGQEWRQSDFNDEATATNLCPVVQRAH